MKYHGFFLFILLFIFLSGCSPDIRNINSKGAAIICFGDSLTRGAGSEPGKDYPSFLGRELGMEVQNAGVNGNKSADGLARIERDVLSKNPRLVIVEFGANDFFQKVPPEETLANLGRIVDLIQEKGAAVVLVEVRTSLPMVSSSLKGLRNLAREKKALFIKDILSGIIFDPALKSDQIHPNSAGYEIMARRISKKIRPLLN
ncbi:MAG: GDSL-type esterase/lipase family protein [bacterium]